MVTQTLKIVNGRIQPSLEPYDASLIELSKETGNAIQIKEDGLYVKMIDSDVETIIDPELDSRLISLENVDIIHNQKILALETSETTQGQKISTLESTTSSQGQKISTLETDYAELNNLYNTINSSETTQNKKILDLETSSATQATKVQNLETSNSTQANKISQIEENLKPSLASDAIGNTSTVTLTEKGYEVYTPSIINGVTSGIELPSNLDNSLPIYTLGNNGEYVLCQPDNWIKIGDNYIPSYTASTLGKE